MSSRGKLLVAVCWGNLPGLNGARRTRDNKHRDLCLGLRFFTFYLEGFKRRKIPTEEIKHTSSGPKVHFMPHAVNVSCKLVGLCH